MIDRFDGPHRFLSNFYPSVVEMGGQQYPTVEHAYQAAKCDRQVYRDLVRKAKTPGNAKRLGRRAEIRPDWEKVKVEVMAGLLRQKFRDPALRAMLMETGDRELIEGNTWRDHFWGVCDGYGHNTLGRLLMAIRTAIKEGVE
jgi:hypothetical protein